MSPGRWIWASGASVVLLCLLLDGAGTLSGGNPKKKVDKQKQYLTQLQARFKTWDKNDDSTLDKTELAQVFRGAQAKPFDYLPVVKVPDQPLAQAVVVPGKGGKVKTISIALAALPRAGLPANLVVAELLSAPGYTVVAPKTKLPTPPPAVNPAQFPDYQFFQMLSKNGKTVTKQDFDTFAKRYAKLLDDVDDAQAALKQAQTKFNSAKTPKAKQQAQTEVLKHQNELVQAKGQLSAIPPAIHKALNIK